MLKRGTKLGKYRIARKIGAGGMSDVYQARDTTLGRDAALKVIPPEFARDKQRLKRFEKEVRAAAALTHPGIVALYDVGKTDDIHYFAMALLGGGDLKDRIRSGIEPDEAVRIVRRIAEALGYAHDKGFIHRDVKPENILFDEEGRWPILTDMGIAKTINSDTRLTATGMSIGTPHYMSPEQAKGKGLDKRSDLYSLGVVLFEMLSGRVPFDADDSLAIAYAHVNDPIPQLPTPLQRFQPVIDKVMAKNPKQRYANAAGLVAALDALSGKYDYDAATQVMPSSDETVVLRASGPRRRLPGASRGWRWGLAGGVIAAAIVAVFVFLERPSALLGGGGGSISPQKPASARPTQPPPVDDPDRSNTANPLARGNGIDPATAGDQPGRPDAPDPSAADQRVAQLEARLQEMQATQRTAAQRRERQRNEQLTGLLSQARGAFAELRIDESATRDPAPLYRRALALDPENADAQSGLEQLLRWYLSRSKLSSEQNDLDKARDYLARAAAIDPDSTAVAALRVALSKTPAQPAGPAAEIKRLLNAAGESFKALRLTTPTGDNALYYYGEVLKLDPDSIEARTGVRRIVGRYLNLARTAQKKGEAARVQANLDKASAIDPGDARIAALRSELKATQQRAQADMQRAAQEQRKAADLNTAVAAYQNRDYVLALNLLKPLAEQGVARAQFTLGLMYYEGRGTPRDEILARQWVGRSVAGVRSAAENARAWAQNALAIMTLQGLATTQDPQLAMAGFQRAADQGYGPAQLRLGVGYETGNGIATDPAQASAWYEKAAAQGLVEAAFRQGMLLEQGLGVPADPARAAQLYTTAAEAGIATAQLRLAQLFYEGRDLPQDYAAAARWYRAAAEQGQALAQAMLGEMLVDGRGITADPAAGVRWLEGAAQQGIPSAQYALGRLYQQGKALGQDDGRAVQLFSAAAQQGHAAAESSLGVMYSQGRGVTQDYTAALDWFRKSAQQGFAFGQYNVGLHYETGRAVKQNYATALDWYNKAAAGGYEKAAEKLARLRSATIVGGFADVSGRLDDLTGKQAYAQVAKDLKNWMDTQKLPFIPLPAAVAAGRALKPDVALKQAQELGDGNPLLFIKLTLPAGTNRLNARCYTADGKKQWSFGRTVDANEADPLKKLFRKLTNGLKSRLGKPCLALPAQQG